MDDNLLAQINQLYHSGQILYGNNSYGSSVFLEAQRIILENTNEGELLLIIDDRSIDSLLAYIGAYNAGRSILLLEFQTANKQIQSFITYFKIDHILGSQDSIQKIKLDNINYLKYFCHTRTSINYPKQLISDQIILLPTSGSSGNPKMVGLSSNNIMANCISINQYLQSNETTISINNLPFTYSYGLSILNTTLFAGGTYICSPETSYLQDIFWKTVQNYQITCFSGVPTTYRDLLRLNLLQKLPNSVKYITQAGGKLEISLQRKLLEWCQEFSKKLYIMYGQTEATARLTYLELTKEPHKLGSVGRPIPGVELVGLGQYYISQNELIFKGENISLGYFSNRDQLTVLKNENQGILKTGDLGRLDKDGCIFIEGRMSRFAKIDGKRISLEDIENSLREQGHDLVVISNDIDIILVAEDLATYDQTLIKQLIKKCCGIRRNRVHFKESPIIRTNNGKINYNQIKKNILNTYD